MLITTIKWKKSLKIVMTTIIADGLTKINLFYDFFFYNTYKIIVSFFNDYFKKSLIASFVLINVWKLRVITSIGVIENLIKLLVIIDQYLHIFLHVLRILLNKLCNRSFAH